MTRRKFLGLMLVGALTLLLGRFVKLFRGRDEKRARYWRRGDNLIG